VFCGVANLNDPHPTGAIMGIIRLNLLAAVLLAGAMSSSASAQSAFDGAWSVLVITQSGSCDRAYRYDVQVSRGTLRYRGEAGINLSGHVNSAGQVRVSIGRGNQSANGTGRLSRNSGSGTWRGRSSQQSCSGRWEAERRG
jgi:hypothetical protein